MNPKKKQFVQGIRTVHKNLRRKVRAGQNFDEVWQEHCENEECLKGYAKSMLDLAVEIWDEECDGTHRIQWCVDTCQEYFFGGGLKKLLEKDHRRRTHFLKNPDEFHCGPNPFEKSVANLKDISLSNFVMADKLDLLDVGSCYDPFRKFDQFQVTAIDLKPACKIHTVYQCDFLKVAIEFNCDESPGVLPSEDIPDGNQLTALSSGHFEVVVFSLLLTYLPSPYIRWKMCEKAYKVMKPNGLLLIITPDSSHQNRNAALMKCWKLAIERIGFQRIKYSKDTHLHFMAFRKVPNGHLWDCKQQEYWDSKHIKELNIPQDFQESSDEDSENCWTNDSERQEFVSGCLTEMPGFDST